MSKPFLFSALIALTFSSLATADEPAIFIEEFDPATIAYVRTVGAYGKPDIIGPAFCKAIGFATDNSLMSESSQVIGIGWDDPETTPLEECRYDACVTVPNGTTGYDGVETTEIPGGTYAVYRFSGKYETIGEDIGKAWGDIAGWMATSDYDFDTRPPLEIYQETKEQCEAGEYVLDLCVAVKKK